MLYHSSGVTHAFIRQLIAQSTVQEKKKKKKTNERQGKLVSRYTNKILRNWLHKLSKLIHLLLAIEFDFLVSLIRIARCE